MRVILTFVLIFSFLSIFADTFEDYYPLSVGDYWTQHSDIWSGGNNPVTFTMEHEAIEQINGESYIRRLNWLEWDDGTNETGWWTWLRANDGGAILGAFGGSDDIAEATIFDPPILWFPNDLCNLGATHEVEIPEMGGTFNFTTDQVGASVTVPSGTFNNCIVISLIITDSTGTTTQDSEFYYAYHVGEVRNYSWNAAYEFSELELTEYNVNLSSPQNEIPVYDIKLSNYPNPFNPETTIAFNIQDSKTGKLEIFNLKGQLTESQEFVSGEYSYVWNAADQASGIYFYKLSTNNISVTKKMLLMK